MEDDASASTSNDSSDKGGVGGRRRLYRTVQRIKMAPKEKKKKERKEKESALSLPECITNKKVVGLVCWAKSILFLSVARYIRHTHTH